MSEQAVGGLTVGDTWRGRGRKGEPATVSLVSSSENAER